jgi:hypothetical protein
MWHLQGRYSGLMPAVYPVQPGSHYEIPESKRRIKNLLDVSGIGSNVERVVLTLGKLNASNLN